MSSQELGLSRKQPPGGDKPRGHSRAGRAAGWPWWLSRGGLALLVVAALVTRWEPCERRNRAQPRCSTHLQWLMVCFGNDWQVDCFLQQNCSQWLRLGISGSSAGRVCVCVLASWAPALCRVTVQVRRRAAGSLGYAGKSCVHLPAAVVVHVGSPCCATLSPHSTLWDTVWHNNPPPVVSTAAALPPHRAHLVTPMLQRKNLTVHSVRCARELL